MMAYLGPSGTFSHAAAKGYIQKKGIKTEIREYPAIYMAIKAVADGTADTAIVPIENSIEGSINVTLDALAFDVNLFIIDEFVLQVEQNILVKPGVKKEDIKKIISHPQAIGQCSKILSDDFGNCEIESAASTSFAAKAAAESDGSIAAVGSASGAEVYGLEILRQNCGDNKDNRTRFAVISQNRCFEVSENDKTSIAFILPRNVPGCLCKALSVFEEKNINILKIESRPRKTALGEYVFFVDIEGNSDNPDIYFALDRIRQNADFYKFLGSYKTDG
ncbi:MAG: prephenate dehydratase [Oscillospiraceae bacterium]|nr:prephenate dehydratase [Oscillospiraceae bacterium]